MVVHVQVLVVGSLVEGVLRVELYSASHHE